MPTGEPHSHTNKCTCNHARIVCLQSLLNAFKTEMLIDPQRDSVQALKQIIDKLK